MTGKERRWLDPNRGAFKLLERFIDRLASRFVYPHLLGLWHPYSWLLPRRFSLAEISLFPAGWPADLPLLKVLLLSDIHTGAFLKPEILADIAEGLMANQPDLVTIAGDIVTAGARDLDGFLPALAPFARAPLGAWYCHGNHDYFDGDTPQLRQRLSSTGITTLRNESTVLRHGHGKIVLGGIDDRILGTPDWDQLTSQYGPPHLLLAHNPDCFYEAETLGIPLTVSGHTHGGQIRFRRGPPIVRHSQFCLDEGAYAYKNSTLIVSRGLGSVGLPWRHGADPEAVMIEIGFNSPPMRSGGHGPPLQ
jgi:predicted MPP superfamily phosphohydrolase